MLRPSTALAFTALALLTLNGTVAAPAQAQSQAFLTRAQLEAHMEEAVFCYYPDDRFSCAWSEIYTERNADHAILISANAAWDLPMEVNEFRIDWRDDALCIPDDNHGLQAMWQSEGYRFPFDLEGLDTLPDEGLPARREQLSEGAPRDFCFQYSNDPDTPGQLLQHVFRDGVVDEEQDPVALIPLFASGVAIRPN